MKSSSWNLAKVAAALVALTLISQAHATTVTLGGTALSVDINISAAPVAVGGFSLLLDYTNLTFASYSIGTGGSLGAAPLDLSFGDLGGTVDLFGLADGSITQAALYAAQNSGGAFTIAHVNFTAGTGTPKLGLRNVGLSDFFGNGLVFCTGAACTGAAVPEPATLLLVASSLGALALRRKQRQEA